MTIKVHEILFKKGILVDLDVHQWRAQKKLTKEDLLLDKTIQEDLYYTGHKKLLPKAALAKLAEIEAKARLELEARSSPFPIAKARFVTFPVLSELMTILDKYQAMFFAALDELLLNYETYKSEQLIKLDAQIQAIADEDLKKADPKDYKSRKLALTDWVMTQMQVVRSLYPPEQQLKARFGFEYRLFKVTNADALEAGGLDLSQATAINKKLEGDMQKWVKDNSTDAHQTLGDAAKHLYDLLDKQGKVHAKNLKPFFDAADKFLASEFLDSKYVGVVKDMKAKYLVEQNGVPNWELMASNINFVSNQESMKNILSLLSALEKEQTAAWVASEAIKASGDFGRVVDVS